MIKKVFRIAGYSIVVILFLLAILLGITQTSLFRESLRTFITERTQDILNGDISIGRIEGTFFTTLTLHDITWHYEDEDPITVREIDVRLNPLALLRRQISVRRITLVEPSVDLKLSRNGKINLGNLVRKKDTVEQKPDAGPDADPKPSRWRYHAEKIEIVNGSFRYYIPAGDSAARRYPVSFRALSYRNISVRDLHIDLSAGFGPVGYYFDVRSMRFEVQEPEFTVEELAFHAVINNELSEVRDLRLRTDSSNIQLEAAVYGYNIFGGNPDADIRTKQLYLSMLANKIHFDELKYFLPPVWFLEGEAAVSVLADGSLDSLNVQGVTTRFGNSKVSVIGNIFHTARGPDLVIDAAIVDSQIDPAEVNKLLPYFTIPVFGDIGTARVTGRYTGKPRDFVAGVELRTAGETYSGNLALNLTGPVMRYKGEFSTEHADAARVLDNERLPRNITMTGTIEGEGTRAGELLSKSNLSIRSMEYGHIGFENVTVNASAEGFDVRLDMEGFIEGAFISASGSGSIEDLASSPYRMNIAARSLDLAPILDDTSFASDLSFRLNARGSGYRPESLLGEIEIELDQSSFRDYTFIGESIYVGMQMIDQFNREFKLESEIADIYIAGEFDLPTFVEISTEHLREIIATVRSDINSIVSGARQDPIGFGRRTVFDRNIDAVYDIRVKNISPLSVVLGRGLFEIDAVGLAYGYYRSSEAVMSIGGDFMVEHLVYIDQNDRVLLDGLHGFYNIENDYVTGGIAGINSIVSFEARRLYTRAVTANRLSFTLDARGRDWQITSSAVIDTTISYTIRGSAYFDTTAVSTEIAQLQLVYGEFDFRNVDPVMLRFDSAGVWVDRFIVHENEMSTVSLSGLLARQGGHQLDVHIVDLDLGNLHSLTIPEDMRRRSYLFSGRADAVGSLRGTSENPFVTAEVRITEVGYRNVSFGEIFGAFRFEDKLMYFDVLMHSPTDSARVIFSLDGLIPFDPLPANGANRFPDGPLSIRLMSDEFDLSILDPFISEVDNLGGYLTGAISIGGMLDDPSYSGNLEIQRGQFVFARNRIGYLFSGSIEPRQNELFINSLMLENRRRDLPDGRMSISGSVRTRGLGISSFNLRADGQLMALKATSREPGAAFYGDLVVATGGAGITLTGSIDESMLTGMLLLRSASLVFPPTRTTAYDRTGTVINYFTVDDTPRPEDSVSPLESFFRGLTAGNGGNSSAVSAGSRFVAGLDYDVIIQTDGRVELTMIFNQTTREELIAHIETSSLRLYSDDLTGVRLIGNVEINEPSVYSFYRRFDAGGNLRFVGPPDNPELNITARYSGQRIPSQQDGVSVGRPEQIVVTLHITGDRHEPKLEIDLTVDDQQWEGDRETDAISFILTGRFQGELSPGDYSRISADFGRGVPATFVSGVATSLLSSVFSDFLRNEVRFIRTAEIVWYGGNLMETAELRVSGELRHFYWTVGGRVFNDINNTNFSFQIPMGPVFNSDRWTNLFIELERRSRGWEYYTDISLRPVNSARLYYSISF